ncbi:MAG: hypothetical protein JXA99_17600 [Candidatus Lokiarchaeota archaeon]|nr:hypothetical protein [Candidatus Lokiarchaeota archaeon]
MTEENQDSKKEKIDCAHANVGMHDGFMVCQDCGLILKDEIFFTQENYKKEDYYDIQRKYEREIKSKDSRAIQNPLIKQKYEKIKLIDKWFRDNSRNFIEQKKTLDLLKSYNIGLDIDKVKIQQIKDRYTKYIRKYKKSYQNMVIIFLAIVWMEIKDLTNIRLEEFIDISNNLGHKINKKMLNNAMLKLLKSENKRKSNLINTEDLEKQIKNKIKILFQKNLNDISLEDIIKFDINKEEFNRLKIEMQLILAQILKKIDYEQIKNLNYKAFTAGLIYFISQTLNPKYKRIFIQSLIEKITKFSSTTIRKKYHILMSILGDP